jgi:hypothetical protein
VIRQTLAAMAVAAALCALGACASPPADPRVAPYLVESRLCALEAKALDAGERERWDFYDECNARSYQTWSGRDGGAP